MRQQDFINVMLGAVLEVFGQDASVYRACPQGAKPADLPVLQLTKFCIL